MRLWFVVGPQVYKQMLYYVYPSSIVAKHCGSLFLLASCCCSPGHHVSYISVALNISTAAKRLRDAANSNDMDTGTGCFGMQMKRCEERRDEELCFCSAKAPGGGCRPLCCRRQGKNRSSFLLLQRQQQHW